MTTLPVQPGDILADKYQVEHVVGKGGMAVVVAARHLQLNQRVALKLLLTKYATDPQVTARFLREARAAVQIRSEHVARILDFGTLPQVPSPGPAYIVMELLDGHDLGALLKVGARFDPATAVDYVLQAAEAIAEAHASGIIHRDLKPANLFLSTRKDGSACIKVLDFGISKMLEAASLTTEDDSLGSPAYMSPEQIRSSKEVDARTDIWAMGTILYTLLTGAPPFKAGSLMATYAEILRRPTPSIRLRRPDVPADLDAVIARCLQKAREDRYPDMSALARALLHFASPGARIHVERIERHLHSANSHSAHFHSASHIELGDDTTRELDPTSTAPADPTTLVRPPPQRLGTRSILLVAAGIWLTLLAVLALGVTAMTRGRR